MKVLLYVPLYVLLTAAAACGGGVGPGDGSIDGEVDAGGETVDAEAEGGHEPDGNEGFDGEEGGEGDGDAAGDAPGDEARDWVRYDGEVPEVAVFEKQDHIASCMRTRACTPENPQQLATCTSAYAHIVGREPGITLQWVARCVVTAPEDCDAVRACLAGGSEPVPCVPLETPDRCEGSVLYQCSRASALTFVFDCANVGMGCFIDTEGYAKCGLGECSVFDFWPECYGDIVVACDTGVITVADCTAAGLVCVETESEPGRCAGAGEPCDEETVGRSCDGSILRGCLGGRMGEVNCLEVVDGWICGPTEGTLGCVVPGDECWAYPLIGSSIEESCSGDSVVTCLDGFVTEISCADYGLGTCVDLGTAARCSAGP